MKKYIIFSIIGLVVLIGVLGGIKGLQINRMIARGEQYVPPPETVTAAVVKPATWPSVLTAVGSLEAVQGVMVTAELTGKVVKIAFEPGSRVKAGDLLVQQDTTSEAAQLRSAEASMELARLNLQRARELLPENVITQSNFDSADAEYKQAAAQVDAIRATIAKKTIRAPFGGKLGHSPGQPGPDSGRWTTHRFPPGGGPDLRQLLAAPGSGDPASAWTSGSSCHRRARR
jgi:membrane fusion protein (multidrug efflux system)